MSSNNSISLKLVRKGDTRRVSVVPSSTSFADLVKLAATLYKDSSLESAVLRYRDSEEDVVNVTSDMELQEAFAQATKSNQILKFWLLEKVTGNTATATKDNNNAEVPLMRLRFCGNGGARQHHQQQQEQQVNAGKEVHAATCDSCHERIVGVRFKCQQCDDYDLCERCQPKNSSGAIHPLSHSFNRIEKATHTPLFFSGGGCPMWRQQRAAVHPATCDSCHERIVGVRFKCQQCDDYDLCERCQPKNADGSIHPSSHSFERIEFATRQHWRAAFEATHRAQQQQQQPQQQQPQKNNTDGKQEAEVVKPAAAVVNATATESKQVESPAVVNVAPLKLRIVTPTTKNDAESTASTSAPVDQVVKVDEKKSSNVVTVTNSKKESIANKSTVDANDNANNSKPSIAPAFESKLKQLQDMGFVDVQKNIAALVESRGDMYGAVRKLLQ